MKMLGYNLRDVISIEVNYEERYLILHLKFLSYQLFIDDDYKLQLLITKLQSFQKDKQNQKSEDVDMPDFYSQKKSDEP